MTSEDGSRGSFRTTTQHSEYALVSACFATLPVKKDLLPCLQGPVRKHIMPAQAVEAVYQGKLRHGPRHGSNHHWVNAFVLVVQSHVRVEMAADLSFCKPYAAHRVAKRMLKSSQFTRSARLWRQLDGAESPLFKAAPGLQHVEAYPKRFVVHGATRRQRQVDYLSGDAVQEAPQVMERDVQPIQGHWLASARPTGSLEALQ